MLLADGFKRQEIGIHTKARTKRARGGIWGPAKRVQGSEGFPPEAGGSNDGKCEHLRTDLKVVSFTSVSAPSEARKRGSGGGSPRRHDDLLTSILLVTIGFIRFIMNNILDVYYSAHPTTPLSRNLTTSSRPRPILWRISEVCCPKVGGGMRTVGCDSEYLTGEFTNFNGPIFGWSTVTTMFRA